MKKLLEYLKIGLAAVVKFTAFPYNAQIIVAVVGGFKLFAGHIFFGLVLVLYAGISAVREYQLRKL
jgi:hypothetical protein